ncbi:hypothetical protein DRQ33_07520 [bacterium]|nr:MAG: hypothetical protein DRQ33_07520 [bacterium]
MNREFTKIGMFACILIFTAIQAVFGIRVSPGVMTVRGIPVGVDTSLGIPLTLYNDEDMDLVYTVRVMKPSQIKKRWRDGYEEIPDTNWLYLADGKKFVVPAKGNVSSMLRIHIPDSESYYNQMWAVYFLVTAKSGGMFNTAVAPLFMLETKTLDEPAVPPAGIPGIAPSAVSLTVDNSKANIDFYNTTESELRLSMFPYIPGDDDEKVEIEATTGWKFDEDFMNGIRTSDKQIELKSGEKKTITVWSESFPDRRVQALIRVEGAPVIRYIRIFWNPN